MLCMLEDIRARVGWSYRYTHEHGSNRAVGFVIVSTWKQITMEQRKNVPFGGAGANHCAGVWGQAGK